MFEDNIPSTFHLLKLPLLACEEILRQMEPLELFDISQCSKKLRSLVKLFTNFKDYRLEFIAGKSYTIYMYSRRTLYWNFTIRSTQKRIPPGELSIRQVGKFKEIASQKNSRLLTMYWNSTFLGAQEIVKELWDLFSVRIEVLTIDIDKLMIEYGLLLEFLVSLNYNFKKIGIFGYEATISPEEYSKTLRLHSKNMNLAARTTSNFRAFKLQVHAEDLKIGDAHWVTFDNLMGMKTCVTVVLDNMTLSFQKVNLFIKKLIKGSHPNLEYIKMVFPEGIDFQALSRDIEFAEEDRDRVYRREDVEIESIPGYRFQLDDGSTGTFIFNGGQFITDFGIILWREGNQQ